MENKNCVNKNKKALKNPTPQSEYLTLNPPQLVNNKEENTEDKGDMQNILQVYQARKNESLERLKYQNKQQNEWLIEDKSYLKLNIQVSSLSNFVTSNFEVKGDNLKELIQISQWETIYDNNRTNLINEENSNTMPIESQNLILKNKIIKLAQEQIMLRSLSLQCEISLLMSGESCFYIFSRCEDKFTTQTALCYISKELESPRKFVTFALLEQKGNKEDEFFIRNIKRQEIPRQDNYIKQLDITEIKFIFVDNGDNQCFLFLEEQKHYSNIEFIGDFYVPFNNVGNVMFGVTGDLISIKKLNIKQAIRNTYINFRNLLGKSDKQSCNCCKII